MKDLHIAVFEIPASGHVNPALGLCKALVERGHRVTFPTGNDYEQRIRQAGAVPIAFNGVNAANTLGLTGIFERTPIQDPNWWAKYASIVYPWFLLNAEVAVAQLEGVYKRDPPDVILYDRCAFAGRILGKRLGVPLIQLYPHFAYYKRSIVRENGVCINPEPMLDFAKLLDRFLAAYGICEDGNLWHTEARNIYFIPKEFQYHQEWFDERSRFVGACLNRPYQPTWKDVRTAAPIILISDMAGAGTDYFNVFVDALGAFEARVILSIGKEINRSMLKQLPSNFEINQDASHLEILPHAALSICQGGMGSTLEALYHGVPVIALPLTRFHEEVTYRMAELGLGYSLPRLKATPAVIRECVHRVLSDRALLGRVRQMQQLFRAVDGARRAADCVEEFLSDKRCAS